MYLAVTKVWRSSRSPPGLLPPEIKTMLSIPVGNSYPESSPHEARPVRISIELTNNENRTT